MIKKEINYNIKYEEFISEILKKYTHYSKFSALKCPHGTKARHINSYLIAEHNGWLERVKKDIEKNHVLMKEKEYESFKEKVKTKYKTYEELIKDKKSREYFQLSHNKWYKKIKNDVFQTYKDRKEIGYWNNFERCLEESKKYKTRREFATKSGTAYYYSRINFIDKDKNIKWIDEMIPLPNMDNKIGNVYYYLFEGNNNVNKAIYIGISIHPEKRDIAHRRGNSAVYNFAKKYNLEIPEMKFLKRNISVKESKKLEGEYVNFYKKQNYIILNKAKCGENSSSVGAYDSNDISFFTYEQLLDRIKNVKKYKNYNEFFGTKEKWTEEYHKAFNESWIRKICKDCGFKTGHNYYKNFDEFLEDVKSKYKTYNSFRYKGNDTRHNSNEWVTALRHNKEKWLLRITKELFSENIKDTEKFLLKSKCKYL